MQHHAAFHLGIHWFQRTHLGFYKIIKWLWLHCNFWSWSQLQIHLPSTMIIGPWELVVKTFTEGNVDGEGKLEVLNEVYHKDIYVLFNPWCKGISSTTSLTPKISVI